MVRLCSLLIAAVMLTGCASGKGNYSEDEKKTDKMISEKMYYDEEIKTQYSEKLNKELPAIAETMKSVVDCIAEKRYGDLAQYCSINFPAKVGDETRYIDENSVGDFFENTLAEKGLDHIDGWDISYSSDGKQMNLAGGTDGSDIVEAGYYLSTDGKDNGIQLNMTFWLYNEEDIDGSEDVYEGTLLGIGRFYVLVTT